jgi:hypothetical protein
MGSWHEDIDLEVTPRWHVFAYLCTMLGHSRDVPQSGMDNGDSHDD